MPPRRRSATDATLTPDDLAKLTAAVADGKRATVYLREGTSSLGLAPGSSARVVSVDGTTVVVRPRGVDDELPYEADELRMTKNPQPAPAPAKAAAPRKTAAKTAVRTSAKASPPPAKTPVRTPPAAQTPDPQTPAAKTPAAKTPARARRGAATSLTVTLYGSPDNQWSVALTRGARKPQRSRPVTPEAVDAAVRELGDEATVDAVSAVLSAARDAAQRRVEELSRELEEARRALEALKESTDSPAGRSPSA
ncbi:DUF6319 family protein [Gordonia caeni]|uniref:Translation initiation factor n=1 Tax=Gordonia caeni TaxID=1007097 RepID=A0ABP7PTS7_9ACTN